MTSSNGNIFRVTGLLCGEFTGHRWIHRTKTSDAELRCFLGSARINVWANNRDAGDLRRHRAHYDVIVMGHNHIIHCQCWRTRGGKMNRRFAFNTLQELQRRHNERDGVSNHQPHDCFLNRSLRFRSKKTSKLRATGLCAGNSPVTGEFLAQWPVTPKMSPFDDVIIWCACF